MDAEDPTGGPHVAELLGQGHHTEAEPEQGIIVGQGGVSLLGWWCFQEDAPPCYAGGGSWARANPSALLALRV
jgi:hypothetical protein